MVPRFLTVTQLTHRFVHFGPYKISHLKLLDVLNTSLSPFPFSSHLIEYKTNSFITILLVGEDRNKISLPLLSVGTPSPVPNNWALNITYIPSTLIRLLRPQLTLSLNLLTAS